MPQEQARQNIDAVNELIEEFQNNPEINLSINNPFLLRINFPEGMNSDQKNLFRQGIAHYVRNRENYNQQIERSINTLNMINHYRNVESYQPTEEELDETISSVFGPLTSPLFNENEIPHDEVARKIRKMIEGAEALFASREDLSNKEINLLIYQTLNEYFRGKVEDECEAVQAEMGEFCEDMNNNDPMLTENEAAFCLEHAINPEFETDFKNFIVQLDSTFALTSPNLIELSACYNVMAETDDLPICQREDFLAQIVGSQSDCVRIAPVTSTSGNLNGDDGSNDPDNIFTDAALVAAQRFEDFEQRQTPLTVARSQVTDSINQSHHPTHLSEQSNLAQGNTVRESFGEGSAGGPSTDQVGLGLDAGQLGLMEDGDYQLGQQGMSPYNRLQNEVNPRNNEEAPEESALSADEASSPSSARDYSGLMDTIAQLKRDLEDSRNTGEDQRIRDLEQRLFTSQQELTALQTEVDERDDERERAIEETSPVAEVAPSNEAESTTKNRTRSPASAKGEVAQDEALAEGGDIGEIAVNPSINIRLPGNATPNEEGASGADSLQPSATGGTGAGGELA